MRRLLVIVGVVAALAATSVAATANQPYDWGNQQDHSFNNGWVVGPCGGEAPVACVFRRGVWRSVVHHGALPLSSLPGNMSDAEALEYVANDILKSFEEDRAIGCPDYQFVSHGIRPRVVGFGDGLGVGFSLRRDGRVTETHTWRLGVQDGYVHWITVEAMNRRSCIGPDPDAPSLTLNEWPTFEKAFDRLAAISIFDIPLGS